MITNDCLIKLREEKYKKYLDTGILKLPKPLFINGEFNKDNWCSGDAIIRDFVYYLENKCYLKSLTDESDTGYYFMATQYDINDRNYTVINIHRDQTFEFKTYTIKCYRGYIEHITLNGKLITEEEYLKLLNFIQDFKIYDFKINNK